MNNLEPELLEKSTKKMHNKIFTYSYGVYNSKITTCCIIEERTLNMSEYERRIGRRVFTLSKKRGALLKLP